MNLKQKQWVLEKLKALNLGIVTPEEKAMLDNAYEKLKSCYNVNYILDEDTYILESIFAYATAFQDPFPFAHNGIFYWANDDIVLFNFEGSKSDEAMEIGIDSHYVGTEEFLSMESEIDDESYFGWEFAEEIQRYYSKLLNELGDGEDG